MPYNIRSKNFDLTELDKEILLSFLWPGHDNTIILSIEDAKEIASLFIEWYEKRIMDGKEEG